RQRQCSERFLNRQIQSVGSLFAPPVVDTKVRARLLVQQEPQPKSGARRKRVEQMIALSVAVDGRGVEERDESEEPVSRQRLAILHLAVQQLIAAIAALAVPARRSPVRIAGRRRQIEIRGSAAGHEVAEKPERQLVTSVRR